MKRFLMIFKGGELDGRSQEPRVLKGGWNPAFINKSYWARGPIGFVKTDHYYVANERAKVKEGQGVEYTYDPLFDPAKHISAPLSLGGVKYEYIDKVHKKVSEILRKTNADLKEIHTTTAYNVSKEIVEDIIAGKYDESHPIAQAVLKHLKPYRK